MTRRRLMLLVLAIVMVASLAVLIPRAVAGIGPNGFAYYAKRGISNENIAIYGAGNTPWIVSCTDRPDYRNLTDTVTCHIREKR